MNNVMVRSIFSAILVLCALCSSGCTPVIELLLFNRSGHTVAVHTKEHITDIHSFAQASLSAGKWSRDTVIERRGIIYAYPPMSGLDWKYMQHKFATGRIPLLLDQSMALYVCDPVTTQKLHPQPEGFPLRPVSKMTNKDFASAP